MKFHLCLVPQDIAKHSGMNLCPRASSSLLLLLLFLASAAHGETEVSTAKASGAAACVSSMFDEPATDALHLLQTKSAVVRSKKHKEQTSHKENMNSSDTLNPTQTSHRHDTTLVVVDDTHMAGAKSQAPQAIEHHVHDMPDAATNASSLAFIETLAEVARGGPKYGDSAASVVLIFGYVGLLSLLVAGTAIWLWWGWSGKDLSRGEQLSTGQLVEKMQVEHRTEKLDYDTYSIAIFSMILDAHSIAVKEDDLVIRASHMCKSFFLLGLTVFMQFFVCWQIMVYCCAKSVYDIRAAYDKFELAMVGNNASRTTLTPQGHHRAMPEYFNESYFDTLDPVLQTTACNIPLSQPSFFSMVLLMWTLTCLLDLKRCKELYVSLILMTPTVDSMKDALTDKNASTQGVTQSAPAASAREKRSTTSPRTPPTGTTEEEEEAEADGEIVVTGLTTSTKWTIFWLVFVPRATITLQLLWLGCRWLAATANFSDLVLNTCGLQFLLHLKGLIYHTFVPGHTKCDMQGMEILPASVKEKVGFSMVFGALTWGLTGWAWVHCYINYFQGVLPEYRWDVRAVCSDWIAERYG
eukprot:gnl/TRDRNA2_/TRDRNA2_179713_c0_seq1.p1 gnl/TRDRNA2_/TRDRNA2_179713_c0~~gnl/TRDRNA2_/TRDRNA2_179713_c0_seq1.p1  ORF type:complete len:580 (+),score=84.72 gnl/TRDRNA2_/TRDRNA2_179713_c0_seq1:107-1846(+)